jgi:hypothetical protein
MKTRRAQRLHQVAAATLACAAVAAGLALAPSIGGPSGTALAQNTTRTPTPTATRRPGAIARLLLKGLNRNSPDGAGTITAQMRLQNDGTWNSTTFEWVPSNDTVQLARETQDGRLRAEFAFFEDTPNGPVEVYRHTERNAPFCVFSDANNRCNGIPIVNGEYRWPDSDGKPGSSTPVKPVRYTLEVNAFGYIDGDDFDTFGNWNNTASFDVEFGEPDESAQLPRQTGRAAITAPRDGSVLKGIVTIRGTATSNNFAFYKFEFEDERCAAGVCFVADGKRAVANGPLLRWDTRSVPNGTFLLRLVVVDRFGRELGQVPRIRITIQN